MLLELVVQILILPVPCTSEINYITELLAILGLTFWLENRDGMIRLLFP